MTADEPAHRVAETTGTPAAAILDGLAASFRSVLAQRLVALVLYGSAVDGSAIPGFSDLDVAVFLRGRFTVEDAIATQAHLDELRIAPFAYLGSRYIDAEGAPFAALVPRGFSIFAGELPNLTGYLHDDMSLRRSGADQLAALPGLLAEDRAMWAVAVSPTRRRSLVRLMVTHLKPTLRAHLVELGEPSDSIWVADWPELASRWRCHDRPAADLLDLFRVLVSAREQGLEVECGALILRLLTRIEASLDLA